MRKVKEIVDYLLTKYPLELASSFDIGKVGLQFGDNNAVIKKAIIALDATSKVVDEAISTNCQMIISHHPFMFSPLLNMDYNSPLGKKMVKVFSNKLNIFAMHTNFDTAVDGMNDLLCNMLNLEDIHSIPEVPVADSYMRYGKIEKTNLKDFALKIKEVFNEEVVRVVGSFDKTIENVAFLGGSGGNYALEAKRKGADVIVTGEVRQNNAIDALDNDIAIVEVSHNIEAHFKQYILKDLQQEFPDVEFILAKEDKNPFACL